jgi:hypothetical protein
VQLHSLSVGPKGGDHRGGAASKSSRVSNAPPSRRGLKHEACPSCGTWTTELAAAADGVLCASLPAPHAVGKPPTINTLQSFSGKHSIRSERQFCERLRYDLLFKFFLDLNVDDEGFDHSTFSRNRERLLTHEIAYQVKLVTFPTGAGEAQVSVYRPALRPSALTWFVILLEDEGQTAFLPHCAVVPSEVAAAYLAGGGVDGKLAITHGLTGRMAEWRVSLEQLGARLGQLTASRP